MCSSDLLVAFLHSSIDYFHCSAVVFDSCISSVDLLIGFLYFSVDCFHRIALCTAAVWFLKWSPLELGCV